MLRRSRPPERIDAGPVVLERVTNADASAIALAVAESLDHLRPWMPWANANAAKVGFQSSRLRQSRVLWRRGTDFEYAIRRTTDATDGPLVGILGLHRRSDPNVIEIGYWIHVNHQGKGYMTSAAAAATKVVLAMRAIERVEIHTDEANVRSAAIPPRLGYRLERVDTRLPEAPGEIGRLQIWTQP